MNHGSYRNLVLKKSDLTEMGNEQPHIPDFLLFEIESVEVTLNYEFSRESLKLKHLKLME